MLNALSGAMVLIESDWNLKLWQYPYGQSTKRINRIRLEFKEEEDVKNGVIATGINRIRLEFKEKTSFRQLACPCRINRIRLEFKVL